MTRRFELPWALALLALGSLVIVGFGPSYAALSPLVGSDSPDFVLVLIPLLAFPQIALDLRAARRDGEELGVNLALAAPLFAFLATLLVILPAKLSYAYWLYRLDLLAVPVFVATAVLLLFGFPALWSARRGVLLLVLGWPPLVDTIIRATAVPLADAQAHIVRVLALPFGVAGSGTQFVFPDGHILSISTACAGLVGVFAGGAVGGVVALAADGPPLRRLGWFALVIGLALAGNAVRLAIVVVGGATVGTGTAFGLLHATVGMVVFAGSFGVALLLLPRFGLELHVPRSLKGTSLPLRRHGAASALGTLAVVALLALGLTASNVTPGLFNGVPALRGKQLLLAPKGWRVVASTPAPGLEQSFGGGTRAAIVHLSSGDAQGVAAQVIVTRSYRRAREYGVVQCFSFHHYAIKSTRYAALGRGGTAALVALDVGGSAISSASWIQPVTIDGQRAWRRVVLYEYAGKRSLAAAQAPGSAGSVSLWILNHLAPYGGSTPPVRFRHSEQQLLALAGDVARAGA